MSYLVKIIIKCISFLFIYWAIFTPVFAYADMSYGSKFFITTLSGCAAGGAGAYTYAEATGYDSQPKQIVTFMGATTGCITGALFSYLFFNDNTAGLTQQVTSDQKTIDDLKNQLIRIQGGQLSGPITDPKVAANAFFTSPLDSNFTSNLIDMKSTPSSELPTGIAIKNTPECKKWARISLIPDADGKVRKVENLQWIALDNNFAVLGIQFAYTNKNCFLPSPMQGGIYFGQYWAGVRDFLNGRVWAVQEQLDEK
jgi:hypothetical protein